MKKIVFLALHLGFGGAEKAIISEANILAERYAVEIICAYKLYEQPAFTVDSRVKITYLSETIKPNKEELKEAIRKKNPIAILKEGMTSLKVLYYRKAKMKQAVQNSDADIIISTRYLYHELLGKHRKPGVITIGQEHNHHKNDEAYINKMVSSVQKLDYFMPVSQELTEFYAKRLKQVKCKYIPHSLDYMPEELSPLKEPMLISVGRLSPEKGYLDLIRVFELVHQEYPQWQLHIVGDGEERAQVESLIQEKGLSQHVVLHGYQKKEYINQLLERASIYVMASHEEAFGIVLIEAQSFGIPCVVFDSARGALEIVRNQENGYVVSNRDKTAMCERICDLIKDDVMRQKLGAKGRENSLQYSVENIKNKWFEFIETI